MTPARSCSVAAMLALAVATTPAFATFHLMQIEQVIGGVNGDTGLQAIQLRMRAAGQNHVSQARLVARDAAGANPVLIVDMTTDVANGLAGSHVLIVSPDYDAAFDPAADFVMTNLIPASYLAAGKLTFEDDSLGIVYWSIAWGGSGYTGANTGSTTNDADGSFSPAFSGPLPSSTDQALKFNGVAGALSTNNAADYGVTAGTAMFTDNAGATGSPLPTPTPTLTATASPTSTPSPTPTPTPTATPTGPTPTPTDTPTATATVTPGGPTLDVDANGASEALTDGLLILRYQFGFRGAILLTGAVAANCKRCDAAGIEAYLAGVD